LNSSEVILGLPEYQVTNFRAVAGRVYVSARYIGAVVCPHCGSPDLWLKDKRVRRPRHDSLGLRQCVLEVESRKWWCRDCRRKFWDRLPGILPHKRATEPFRRSVYRRHCDGINASCLSRHEGICGSTVVRWTIDFLQREVAEFEGAPCPRVLGIDEHFFSRKDGYATTLCNLQRHTIFDVVLGRSEAALESYLAKLPGKERVRVVCMDLSSTYRAIVRKWFPNARIVADRFHVIRLITMQFLACWREIDPAGAKHRGLLSLMRRHRHNLKPEQKVKLAKYFAEFPAVKVIYQIKQRLCYQLLKKHRTRQQCVPLVKEFLNKVQQLKECGLAPLVQLGETLSSWAVEIATMWRFTRNNGITEGFHTKMELLQRQAFGYRNFKRYRLRVRVMCR